MTDGTTAALLRHAVFLAFHGLRDDLAFVGIPVSLTERFLCRLRRHVAHFCIGTRERTGTNGTASGEYCLMLVRRCGLS